MVGAGRSKTARERNNLQAGELGAAARCSALPHRAGLNRQGRPGQTVVVLPECPAGSSRCQTAEWIRPGQENHGTGELAATISALHFIPSFVAPNELKR